MVATISFSCVQILMDCPPYVWLELSMRLLAIWLGWTKNCNKKLLVVVVEKIIFLKASKRQNCKAFAAKNTGLLFYITPSNFHYTHTHTHWTLVPILDLGPYFGQQDQNLSFVDIMSRIWNLHYVVSNPVPLQICSSIASPCLPTTTNLSFFNIFLSTVTKKC